MNPDVQLGGPGQPHATIFFEDEGETLRVPLDSDQFHMLRDQITDAWLNAQGFERRVILWEDAQPRDIIPCFGGHLIDVPHVLPGTDRLRGYVQGVGQFDLNRGLEITVHRLIA